MKFTYWALVNGTLKCDNIKRVSLYCQAFSFIDFAHLLRRPSNYSLNCDFYWRWIPAFEQGETGATKSTHPPYLSTLLDCLCACVCVNVCVSACVHSHIRPYKTNIWMWRKRCLLSLSFTHTPHALIHTLTHTHTHSHTCSDHSGLQYTLGLDGTNRRFFFSNS